MTLTPVLASRVARRLKRYGFDASGDDVWLVYESGTHPNAALASAILQEFEELGIES
jgi:hypothetical protein